MSYTIVRTIEKLSQKRNPNDGSVDYIIRRGFKALPTEEVASFIEKFENEASNALALFEVKAEDIIAVLAALQTAAREIEVRNVTSPGC